MALLQDKNENLLMLMEQFKVMLSFGESIENAIKKTAVFYPEFPFLKELSSILEKEDLETALYKVIQNQNSENTRLFFEALGAKNLAEEKLEELRMKIIEKDKKDFEKLVSVGGKVSFIAGIMFIPLFINFISSLSDVFSVIGIEFTISESTSLIVLIGTASLITYLMFSRRKKNG